MEGQRLNKQILKIIQTHVKSFDLSGKGRRMFDHICFAVSSYDRAKSFYSSALAPLGYVLMTELKNEDDSRNRDCAGFGNGYPDFWISGGMKAANTTHVAFRAKDRGVVDTFYRAAIAAGGRDNGAPEVRSDPHEDCYSARVLDPDGNSIEAVFRNIEPQARSAPYSIGGIS